MGLIRAEVIASKGEKTVLTLRAIKSKNYQNLVKRIIMNDFLLTEVLKLFLRFVRMLVIDSKAAGIRARKMNEIQV